MPAKAGLQFFSIGNNTMKVIGLMSGTSADGIDAALVEIDRDPLRLRLLAFEIFPYPPTFQKRLLDLAAGSPRSVALVCHLNAEMGERLADAVTRLAQQSDTPLEQIMLIGSHGQTVCHLPVPKRVGRWRVRSTLQIGEPSIIAERTGVTTISDFRARDMAAGGEGAPLTPALHYILFSDAARSRAVVNIGGISNITALPAGGAMAETAAFDMCPGNMLIDGIVDALTHGRQRMDRNGRRAARGHVDTDLLRSLMRHPFIRRPPPKSTGRESFGPEAVARILARGGHLPQDDLVATVTAFTADAIAENLRRHVKGSVDEMLVCGGGGRNPTLMARLAHAVAPTTVRTTDDLGYPGRAIEAMAFAMLAYHTWQGEAGNIPTVTGARRPVILGKIVPGRLPIQGSLLQNSLVVSFRTQ